MNNVKARRLRPYERRKLRSMKRQLTNSVNKLHARIILLSRGGNKKRPDRQTVRLFVDVGTMHHPPLQRRRCRRYRMVSLLLRTNGTA